MRRAHQLLAMTCWSLASVTGCASMEVAAVGSVVPEPEHSYLVQVLTQPPEEAYLLVIGRVALDPLDKRPLEEALGEDRLTALRSMAAARGAERLLLEESWVRGKRWAYGLGISTSLSSHLSLKPPRCEGLGVTEAKARVARKSSLCLKELALRRKTLRATAHVRFRVDPFGDLMMAAALPESSRDSQVQACVLEALEDVTYPRPPSLVCEDTVQIVYP